MPTSPKMDIVSWALLLTLSVLWGASFFFAKVALQHLPPLTLVFLRVAIAALALVLVVRATGRRFPTDTRTIALCIALGAFNNAIPFILLFWGQTRIDSGLAAILNATTPISTIVIAHALTTDEKMSAAKLFGTLFGVAGVVLLVGPEALRGASAQALAQLACLGATVSYGLAATIGRRVAAVDPMVVSAGQLVASSVIMLPVALIFDQPWDLAPPPIVTWMAVAALALVSTALAYVLYFSVIARAGATNAALVTVLVPVTAILLGASFLGERLSAASAAGLALIVIGLVVIDGRWRPLHAVGRRCQRRAR